MLTKRFSAVLLSGLCLTAQATQLWSNKGYRSGCDSFNIDNTGTGAVLESTSEFLESPQSLKAQQTYNSNWGGRYHAECVHNDGYKRGDERFYSFSFRLQQNWDFQGAQSYNLAQFIAQLNNKCDDWKPAAMLGIRGNQFYARRTFGNIEADSDCKNENVYHEGLATVTAGVWHTVIIQAKWASDNTGYYKVWYDGTKVVNDLGKPSTLNDNGNRQFRFQVGLYANQWFDSNNQAPPGGQNFRQVWIDELAIGTTYADVDPAQWARKGKSRVMRAMIDEE
ncbi:hypothetical protein EJ05DRAFT_344648 [Pseudovirgaria hyperparasitica]|uniref:Concanavalin A-like lectin/glucanase n=1 Tax=Pseudovirgaria hyperparasitica TaxID=470096 RepID=A0A6A6WE48_9PEZI|nr:uncharacterized protein EJ05DRAFT_344648 [Pseudovirgaria hyperparasitica]KAF2759391.1 hypothetical protein EJ05DRAFT_344648 [Pseudovirgaria hyperparasitica]